MRFWLLLLLSAAASWLPGCYLFQSLETSQKDFRLSVPAEDAQVLNIELGGKCPAEVHFVGSNGNEIRADVQFRGASYETDESAAIVQRGMATLTGGSESRLAVAVGKRTWKRADEPECVQDMEVIGLGEDCWYGSMPEVIIHVQVPRQLSIHIQSHATPYSVQDISITEMTGGATIVLDDGGVVRMERTKGPVEVVSRVPIESTVFPTLTFRDRGSVTAIHLKDHCGSVKFQGAGVWNDAESKSLFCGPPKIYCADRATLDDVTGNVQFAGIFPANVEVGKVDGEITFTSIPDLEKSEMFNPRFPMGQAE